MRLVSITRSVIALWKSCLILAVLCFPLAVQAHTWVWTAEDIEAIGGESPSLALDGHGNLHLSYRVTTGSQLKYGFRDAGTAKWFKMTIDRNLIVFSTGITVDASGNPQICYTPNTMKYARFDGRKWSTQTIDQGNGQVGYLCSIRVTNSGVPMMSWYLPNGGFRYAVLRDGRWVATGLDGNPNDYAGKWNSMVLDSKSNPSIAYSDFPFGQLRYARYDGSKWVRSVIHSVGDDPGGYKGMGASIALDPHENPWISYYDEETLRVAHLENGKWVKTVVEKLPRYVDWGWKEFKSDIIFDHTGNPHVIFESLKGLEHAWWDGSDWHLQMIVATSSVPEFDNSAAIDKDDVLYVAYRDPVDGVLKLAIGKPSKPMGAEADAGGH